MNEINRREQEYVDVLNVVHSEASGQRRLTFLLPDRCIAIKREIAHLRKVKGIRRGTSMVAHKT